MAGVVGSVRTTWFSVESRLHFRETGKEIAYDTVRLVSLCWRWCNYVGLVRSVTRGELGAGALVAQLGQCSHDALHVPFSIRLKKSKRCLAYGGVG